MADLSAYLDRIGQADSGPPTAELLRNLHRAHLFSVPFENLDIALRRKTVLDEESFIHKIVARRRGGFCYELNGAFAALLRGLGFQVTLLTARVPRTDGTESPEFDHLTLRVDLDKPWLADVGFGDSFLEPLVLEIGEKRDQDGRNFRLVRHGAALMVERLAADGWQQQYSFTLTPRRLDEFAPMCHYHQTSPESHFTRKGVCSIATPQGRTTLTGRNLIVTRDGVRKEQQLSSEEEWRAALRQYFGLVL
jgi:N-hydroxyarylamine O-acetyltransferase